MTIIDTHGMLRVGSRESPLAVAQAEIVIELLRKAHPELNVTLRKMKTTGDKVIDTSLGQIGEKGLFVKELEDALLKNEIDVAVHSAKDMPGELPVGLVMQSAGKREDARDVLISKTGETFSQLPARSVVGTSSARRMAQLKRKRPDLQYKDIRGNLQTRYNKLMEARGEYRAIVLAAAGVHRLDWQDKITEYFDPETDHVPAVGQGILAVEYRQNDKRTAGFLEKIKHKPTETVLLAERTLLKKLEGGCSVPLGAYCWHDEAMNVYRLRALLMDPRGNQAVFGERSFPGSKAREAALDLASEMLKDGADILKEIRR